ncbi:hypothetical protein KKD19_01835 [Patescibacteria group bacterium]|nr:hypothetical protein [Patescibacteria group bacterium]MBU4511969.1 hypothetical protein [Patescibacteria group bacterium]MCG2693373.1 hypothetical protein [Candidatus Parcubacteria bacterium]
MFENQQQNQTNAYPPPTQSPNPPLVPPLYSRPKFKTLAWLLSTCLNLFKQNAKSLILLTTIFVAAFFIFSIIAIGISLVTVWDSSSIQEVNQKFSSFISIGLPLIITYVIFILAQIITKLLFQASLILKIYNLGTKLSLKDIILKAFKKLLPFMLVKILTGLIASLPLIALGLLYALATPREVLTNETAVIALGVLTLLSLGCLFWMSIKLFPAPYLVLIENQKIIQALENSWRLTRGYWFAIFSKLVIFFLLLSLAAILVNIIPLLGPLVALFIVPPLAALFTFLVYENLRLVKNIKIK